jgi:hypothetical protein
MKAVFLALGMFVAVMSVSQTASAAAPTTWQQN